MAWLPPSLVADDLSEGRLVEAADEAWRVPLQICIYRERDLVGRAAQAFWDLIIQSGHSHSS